MLSPSISLRALESDTPLPHSMASMGDSITAGMFANFRRQDFIFPWTRLYLIGELIFSSLGKNLDLKERRQLSWATGLDSRGRVQSHALRLEKLWDRRGSDVAIYNAAVSGADSEALESQYLRLRKWSEQTLQQAAPDYVTLLLGPNDICAKNVNEMTDVGTYQARVQNIVHALVASEGKTRVLVSTLPDVETLRKIALKARLSGIGLLGRCENLWKLAKTCPTLTLTNDPEDRARVAERVLAYNEALRQIVENEGKIFGDRVRLAPQTYDIKFTANDLSIDCFHPNPKGQQKISDATWAASWWAK